MALWAIYSDHHTEVDIAGNRDGLLAFATAIIEAEPNELTLDDAPASWQERSHPLRSIRVEPSEGPDPRIRFQRTDLALLVSGQARELARIVGGSVRQLAGGPSKINTVGAHVHLDPTSDPDRRTYTEESISLVIHFAEADE